MQKLLNWVDERLPVVDAWNKHLAKYYAPKNFNFWNSKEAGNDVW